MGAATAVMISCSCIIPMKISHRSSLVSWMTRYHHYIDHLALAEIIVLFSDHELGSKGKVTC